MKEVTPQEAFAALSADETAILVDCRSRAEWDLYWHPRSFLYRQEGGFRDPR